MLGSAYHFPREIVIRQLQRIVAKMIKDSVGHFLLETFAEVRLIFFYPRQSKLYITRTDRLLQMRQEEDVVGDYGISEVHFMPDPRLAESPTCSE
jgi:hypothetical protein